jgi:hypothetical protein
LARPCGAHHGFELQSAQRQRGARQPSLKQQALAHGVFEGRMAQRQRDDAALRGRLALAEQLAYILIQCLAGGQQAFETGFVVLFTHTAPPRVLGLSGKAIVVSAVTPEKLPIQAARRLWNVYFGVVEAVKGAPDPNAYGPALARVAQKSGVLDKQVAKAGATPQSTLGQQLMMGLDINSNAWIAFAAAYPRARK